MIQYVNNIKDYLDAVKLSNKDDIIIFNEL